MDLNKIRILLKYALAVAGLEDPGNQELGPIHLTDEIVFSNCNERNRRTQERGRPDCRQKEKESFHSRCHPGKTGEGTVLENAGRYQRRMEGSDPSWIKNCHGNGTICEGEEALLPQAVERNRSIIQFQNLNSTPSSLSNNHA
jgi:hypothetical protein